MADLDLTSHLSYLQSCICSTKAILGEIQWQRLQGGDTSNAEQKLQAVGFEKSEQLI